MHDDARKAQRLVEAVSSRDSLLISTRSCQSVRVPLFRGKKQPPAQLPLAAPLAADREVIVVGTEHYTDVNRLPPGPVGPVTVEPEPGSKYDRNAVLVRLAERPVGYLSAARARTYRPLLSGVHPVQAHVKKAAVNTPDHALFVMLPRVPHGGTTSR